jgi:hypothetical protein
MHPVSTMHLNNLLRFDYWLDPSVINQPAGRVMWLAAALAVVMALVLAALTARKRIPRDMGLLWTLAAGVFALVCMGRILQVPLIGWRIGWLIAAVIALVPIVRRVAGHIVEDTLVQDCIDALAFAPVRDKADWHISTALAWVAFNAIALAVVVANINLPGVFALPLLLLLMAPVLIAFVVRAVRREPLHLRHLASLAPLTVTYITALLSVFKVEVNGVINGVFFVPLSLIVTSAVAFVIAGRFAIHKRIEKGDWRFVRASAVVLVVAALGWSAWAALTLRTHGVTGSDPYAYAQMGIDLATRGTVFHPFPLVKETYALNIASYPITHIGYRIPADASREATTVWPPGYAVFTALAYLAGGETGVYLITPLLNLISLIVVAWFALTMLSQRLLRHSTPPPTLPQRREEKFADSNTFAIAVAALTVALTATSYQQVEWQMIPMADVAAQLFTLLAVGIAFSARGSLAKAVLSGMLLGIAYNIRYTQVLACVPIALALLHTETQNIERRTGFDISRRSLTLIVVCAGAALIAVLPTLIYHQVAFGNPLATGSEELSNFSLTLAPQTLLRALGELNWYREFGLLTPFILIGVIAMWREHQPATLVLLTLIAVLFGFHILYAYLRLRDILFLFPVFYLFAAYGIVRSFVWLNGRTSSISRHASNVMRLALVTFLFATSFMLVLRSMETLALPVTRGFAAFGYLVKEQRASFDALAAMTPANVVIGTSLNSGAIDLHSDRDTYRPATWTPDELTKFVDLLHSEGRPVFLVNDGDALRDSLATLQARYTVREAGRIDVPYYDTIGGGSSNRRVEVLAIEPRQ